jgi:histidine triad (HIT) family protein
VPADIVFEDEQVVAFRDVNPQAPTHVLVVPRAHAEDVVALARQDSTALTALVLAAGQVAQLEGAASHRLVFNTGADAGQSVRHVHGHVLAGRRLTWPPG